ncbi:MAG: adenylate kinase family protein [Candidatus Aenigmarchaeota archaeon]|nr:adenylate kinase family protein [Candidatus Aenigmarchaeota archaeon]
MIIAISGTPGTGKTEVAKALAALMAYAYVSINDFAEKGALVKGVDRARNAKIIDTDALEKVRFADNSVLDGHVSHFATADVYVILRTNPDVLRKRLGQKGWNKRKIDENVEAEAIGVCSVEARELWDNVMDIDTSALIPAKAARLIYNWLKRKRFANDPIDWTMKGYEP